MSILKRKDGKTSKGKAGPVGGGVAFGLGLLLKIANKAFDLGLPEEAVDSAADAIMAIGAAAGTLIGVWGVRDKQERGG